jgi:FKBP-type peptidyl-prolyl cis-trans isomerase SlyD
MTGKRRARRGRSGPSGGHQIGPGIVAALAYELFDAEGELVEASEAGAPLVLLFGYGDAVPALEHALQGLGEGDTREVVLPPEQAFGARDPEAIIEVDRAEFPPDVAAGDELEADREDGRGAVPLKVIEVLDDIVVLDTNHPLAGQRVKLLVVVEAVRPATPEEIEEASERLLQDRPGAAPHPGPLLPAERLLRRVRGDQAPDGDEPQPPPSGRTD